MRQGIRGLQRLFTGPYRIILGVPIAMGFVLTLLIVATTGVRAINVLVDRTPLPGDTKVLQTNSGNLIATSVGVFPRNQGVLVASHPALDISFVATRVNDLELKLLRELDSELAIYGSYSLEEAGLRELEGVGSKSIRLFDLETDGESLFVSLVASDFSQETCDIYLIFEIDMFMELLSPKGEELWRSDVCRSANTPSYNWPDFTGRMAVSDEFLYLTAGLSSMNMLYETWPESRMSGVAETLDQELVENELFGGLTQISLQSGSSNLFARGLRSPAGVALRPTDMGYQIWVSDHGPRGGDELNLMESGQDYGWPWVTLGSNYGLELGGSRFTAFENHEGYREPAFWWSPSIAPSQLVCLKSAMFSRLGWQPSNLVLGTLKDKSINVIKIDEISRVESIERISIGHRVRDMAESSKGLVLGTDDGLVIILTPQERILTNSEEVGTFPAIEPFSWDTVPVIGWLVNVADSIVASLVRVITQ